MIISTDRLSANDLRLTLARPGKAAAHTPAPQAAPQAFLTPAAEHLAVKENNLTAANSHLQDVDAAKATLDQVRKSILGQSRIAMLAQANSLPQSALQLLQE